MEEKCLTWKLYKHCMREYKVCVHIRYRVWAHAHTLIRTNVLKDKTRTTNNLNENNKKRPFDDDYHHCRWHGRRFQPPSRPSPLLSHRHRHFIMNFFCASVIGYFSFYFYSAHFTFLSCCYFVCLWVCC